MKLRYIAGLLAVVIALAIAAFAFTAAASHQQRRFVAVLSGYEEVPAVSTSGWGFAEVVISEDEDSVSYELSYFDMEGEVTMAHIHLGRAGTNGGVVVWLCGGPKPPCPPGGTVSGTLTANDVVGPAAQGISEGELDELIAAIRAGAAYVNVHSDMFPAGEVRGQLE